MRQRLAKGLFSLGDSLFERGATAARGGSAFKWAANASSIAGGFAASRNGFNTIAGAAAGGAYGAISDDTSVLGGMAMGAAIGRYGGQAIRSGRGTMGPLRSSVGASGPVVPLGAGRAFGQAVMYGGGSSARLIGSDITKAYNGFKGLFKGGRSAGPPTALAPGIPKKIGWKDPNTTLSVMRQRRLRAGGNVGSAPSVKRQQLYNSQESLRRGVEAERLRRVAANARGAETGDGGAARRLYRSQEGLRANVDAQRLERLAQKADLVSRGF